MRTIQAVARYFPESCGGIHIHLSELLPVLKSLGLENQVVASQDGPKEDFYDYQGTPVYRYPVSPMPKTEPNHGMVPHGEFEKFAAWLKENKADVYHQHQWTPKCGLPHLRLAKELGMATVVSVRLPQPMCMRQTLMLHGQTACDGKIDVVRCSQCCGVSQAIPSAVIKGLGQVPVSAGIAASGALRRLSKLPTPMSKVADALLNPVSVPTFINARKQGLMEMAKYADRIVVMSKWVYDALAINDIPEEKLFLLKHGISDSFAATANRMKATVTRQSDRPLRIGFLGRWDQNKGIHILVDAVKSLPAEVPVELIIHGVAQDESYRQRVMAAAAEEPRIKVERQLKREDLPSALPTFDVLAVPSQWLETGPVVVLEAHACGVPVVGSDLGGVAEKVKHGVDGLLVPADNVKAWADAFAQLAMDANLLHRLRNGIQPVRTISMEAAESVALYRSILTQQPIAQAESISNFFEQLQLQPE